MTLRLTAITSAIRSPRLWGAATWLVPGLALANPVGGDVVGGAAVISNPDANTVRIDQTTDSAAINWQSFSIDGHEYVIFNQPSVSSATLNRVLGENPSAIFGHIQANGRVFLINPNGVMFGQGAQVDVNGLVATTLDISPQDFMAGKFEFKGGSTKGVINAGSIQAGENGFVVLAGDHVQNSGQIAARLGKVVLASGSEVTLDIKGNGLVSYAINAAAVTDAAGVENLGVIAADGGAVYMDARVARSLTATVVNNSGLVQARSISTDKRGGIYLNGDGGDVVNSGVLNSSAAESGRKGGTVIVRSTNDITLKEGSLISANGPSGGEIRVVAEKVAALNPGSVVEATGPGGFIELSGHGRLDIGGEVNLHKGTLLIDPDRVEIDGCDIECGFYPYGSSTLSTIPKAFLEQQLQDGNDVIIVAEHQIKAVNFSSLGAIDGRDLDPSGGYGEGGSLTLGIGTAIGGGPYGGNGIFYGAGGVFARGPGGGGYADGIDLSVAGGVTIRIDGDIAMFGGSAEGNVTTGSNGDLHSFYGNVQIEGQSVNRTGAISAYRDITVRAVDGLFSAGTLTAETGNISVDAYGAIITGSMSAFGNLRADSETSAVSVGHIQSSQGDIVIDALGSITSGDITASDAYGDVTLDSANGSLNIGDVTAGQKIDLRADVIDFSYQELFAPEIRIEGRNGVTITDSTLAGAAGSDAYGFTYAADTIGIYAGETADIVIEAQLVQSVTGDNITIKGGNVTVRGEFISGGHDSSGNAHGADSVFIEATGSGEYGEVWLTGAGSNAPARIIGRHVNVSGRVIEIDNAWIGSELVQSSSGDILSGGEIGTIHVTASGSTSDSIFINQSRFAAGNSSGGEGSNPGQIHLAANGGGLLVRASTFGNNIEFDCGCSLRSATGAYDLNFSAAGNVVIEAQSRLIGHAITVSGDESVTVRNSILAGRYETTYSSESGVEGSSYFFSLHEEKTAFAADSINLDGGDVEVAESALAGEFINVSGANITITNTGGGFSGLALQIQSTLHSASSNDDYSLSNTLSLKSRVDDDSNSVEIDGTGTVSINGGAIVGDSIAVRGASVTLGASSDLFLGGGAEFSASTGSYFSFSNGYAGQSVAIEAGEGGIEMYDTVVSARDIDLTTTSDGNILIDNSRMLGLPSPTSTIDIAAQGQVQVVNDSDILANDITIDGEAGVEIINSTVGGAPGLDEDGFTYAANSIEITAGPTADVLIQFDQDLEEGSITAKEITIAGGNVTIDNDILSGGHGRIDNARGAERITIVANGAEGYGQLTVDRGRIFGAEIHLDGSQSVTVRDSLLARSVAFLDGDPTFTLVNDDSCSDGCGSSGTFTRTDTATYDAAGSIMVSGGSVSILDSDLTANSIGISGANIELIGADLSGLAVRSTTVDGLYYNSGSSFSTDSVFESLSRDAAGTVSITATDHVSLGDALLSGDSVSITAGGADASFALQILDSLIGADTLSLTAANPDGTVAIFGSMLDATQSVTISGGAGVRLDQSEIRHGLIEMIDANGLTRHNGGASEINLNGGDIDVTDSLLLADVINISGDDVTFSPLFGKFGAMGGSLTTFAPSSPDPGSPLDDFVVGPSSRISINANGDLYLIDQLIAAGEINLTGARVSVIDSALGGEVEYQHHAGSDQVFVNAPAVLLSATSTAGDLDFSGDSQVEAVLVDLHAAASLGVFDDSLVDAVVLRLTADTGSVFIGNHGLDVGAITVEAADEILFSAPLTIGGAAALPFAGEDTPPGFFSVNGAFRAQTVTLNDLEMRGSDLFFQTDILNFNGAITRSEGLDPAAINAQFTPLTRTGIRVEQNLGGLDPATATALLIGADEHMLVFPGTTFALGSSTFAGVIGVGANGIVSLLPRATNFVFITGPGGTLNGAGNLLTNGTVRLLGALGQSKVNDSEIKNIIADTSNFSTKDELKLFLDEKKNKDKGEAGTIKVSDSPPDGQIESGLPPGTQECSA